MLRKDNEFNILCVGDLIDNIVTYLSRTIIFIFEEEFNNMYNKKLVERRI